MEKKIIKMLEEGNEDGIQLVQSHYGNMIKYIVGSIIQDKEDQEECISDIYLKVWNKFCLYDKSKGKLSTWITSLARNTALNYLNKKNIPTVELTDTINVPTSPEAALLKKEELRRLKNTINSLLPEEQQLFYRKYYYLQSTAQIAAEMGKSQRSVEGKLYRMRNKLKKKLGGSFYE